MTDRIGSLVAKLGADIAEFRAGMNESVRLAESTNARIENALGGVQAAINAVAGSALVLFVKGLVESAEQTGRLAERLGHSVSDFSQFTFAAQQGHVSIEDFTVATARFNKSLVDATDGTSKVGQLFKALGVDIKQGPAEALREFARNASAIDDAKVKIAVFKEAMGRAGDALIPVFKNLEESGDQARRLGAIMTDETVAAARRLDESMGVLTVTLKMLATNALEPSVTGLATITENLVKAAEKGQFWNQVLRETLKITAVLASLLPGVYGRLGDKMAEFVFENTERKEGIPFGDPNNPFGLPKTPAASPNSRALASILSSDTGRELKLYTTALQEMEEKLGKLNNKTQEEIVLARISTGSWKTLSGAHAVELLNIAVDIDQRKQHIDQVEIQYKLLTQAIEQQQKMDGLREDAMRTAKLENDDLRFKIQLLGQSAEQQERLTAIRQVDLAMQDRIKQRTAALPEDAMTGLTEKIIADEENASQALKQSILRGLADRRAAERDWLIGAKSGFNEYIEAATNAGALAHDALTNSLHGLEDALTQFFATGKANWRAFGNAIINELARIEAKKVTAGLASTILSWFASTGTGSSGKTGSSDTNIAQGLQLRAHGGDYGPGPLVVGENGPELLFPETSGTVMPNDRLATGGGLYYIDARGADMAAAARMERAMAQMNATFDQRAARAALAHRYDNPGVWKQ